MAKKTGRPPKYKAEYAEMLTAHMKDGLSFESFGGVVGVCEKTLYNWEAAHPEFLQAKMIGRPASRLYWEKVGKDGLYNETIKTDDGMTVNRSINSAIWIFNMKNRFQWRDKIEIDTPEDEDRPLKELSDNELQKLRGNGKR